MAKRNKKNLKKVMDTVSNIGDVVSDKYEANTAKIMEKLDSLQSDMAKLLTAAQTKPADLTDTEVTPPAPNPQEAETTSAEETKQPTILTFSSWEDLQAHASEPRMVGFTIREAEKRFEVDAAKEDQVFVYVGEMPKLDELFKTWISSQLAVAKEKVFEGTIKT